ncbi:SAM-dependent methyltransferase [Actinosynnema sp. ALI-1.44]|uniref:class I SAM-dependent methyltransferase n=1 Tax=Actinosynnema sp. ALI-1.44 TaxID=1933779 RepID=UPI00097C7C64|nr:class I SAM-dependent methyltransferase [Actinosynnema sp. ALI-1.44]ONI76349.1 SAM-dependent methyltransferase [Actinosynnema sp. ALI-1.44]
MSLSYGSGFAEIYEVVYRGRGKDWADEARTVAEMATARFPAAATLLDVACGTGAHLETFRDLFDHVEGVDRAPAMRAVAEARLPGVPIHDGDMRDFDLGRTFDVVCCMFNSIGYVGGLPSLRAALCSMARHLVPGGVLVVEPWYFPETFVDGHVAGDLVNQDGLTVARVSHTVRHDRTTTLEVRFLIGDRHGIRDLKQVSVLTLFTKDEYLTAFAQAGCPAAYIEGGLANRGMFVGVRQ